MDRSHIPRQLLNYCPRGRRSLGRSLKCWIEIIMSQWGLICERMMMIVHKDEYSKFILHGFCKIVVKGRRARVIVFSFNSYLRKMKHTAEFSWYSTSIAIKSINFVYMWNKWHIAIIASVMFSYSYQLTVWIVFLWISGPYV